MMSSNLTEHGFLTDRGEIWIRGRVEAISMVRDLETLIDIAYRYKLSHLWITPACTCGLEHCEATRASTYDIRCFKNKATGQISSLVGRLKKAYSRNVNVIWLSTGNWDYQNETQFIDLIDKIEVGLGVPMRGSPTTVGLRYLEKISKQHYDAYFEDPGLDKLAMRATFREAAKPLIWCRQPLEQELSTAKYLVAVDKRAAYPRAAVDKLGIGLADGYFGEFDAALPGIWDVEIAGLDQIDGRLPAALWEGWEHGGLTTPIVKMLQKLGCTITVKSAVVWHKKAPVFERWAKTLWDLRQEIDGVKAIMNQTLGFTINSENMDDEAFRPDWHAHVVGGLRALMLYNAQSIAQAGGLYPIGCYIDALYYLSPEPCVAGLALSPGSMGGYAQKWALPLTDEVRELVTSPEEQKHFNMMLHKLNMLAGAE